MTNTILAIGIPMILFVVLDSLQGLKAALIGAVLACLFEVGYSLYAIGEVDSLTMISISLILVLAGTSFIKKDSLYFKLQPAILAGIISIFFLGCWWFERNFMFEMMVKYQKLIPEQSRELLTGELAKQLFAKVGFYSIFSFGAHGIAMYYIAKRCSNLIWVIARAAGTFGSVFLAFVCAQLF